MKSIEFDISEITNFNKSDNLNYSIDDDFMSSAHFFNPFTNLNLFNKLDDNEESLLFTFAKENNSKKDVQLPEYHNYDQIKEILLTDSNLTEKIKEYLTSGKYICDVKKIIEPLLNKKKKRRKRGKMKFTQNINVSGKPGRKKLNDSSKREHTKFSPDNIIKKIKIYLFEKSLGFINNIFNNYLDKKKLVNYNKSTRKKEIKYDDSFNVLKPLDYKYINTIKRDNELSILDKPLKDIFSKDISPKYNTFMSNSNKIIIDKILNDEKDNESIMFALNLTFREWFDIFLYKKEFKNCPNFDEVKMKDLINKFEHIDVLLNEVYIKNNDNNYLTYFIYFIYNYEWYFYVKKSRHRVSKKTGEY